LLLKATLKTPLMMMMMTGLSSPILQQRPLVPDLHAALFGVINTD